MVQHYAFDDVARLPAPEDNVAIATRKLPAATIIDAPGSRFALDATVMEGHRFAVRPIATGEPLLSWGLPFGYASRDIQPGMYVCNAQILQELRRRQVDFELPIEANFLDKIEPYELDAGTFRAGTQVSRATETRTFRGYERPGQRGVGTRNYVVILGTSSRTASYARALEERLRPLSAPYAHLDGIVAVAHTEGGGPRQPHNLDLVLRTLSGFMVHPNVGAILAVDYGLEPITNAMLRQYMRDHNYPLEHVQHRFLTLAGSFQSDLERGATIIESWLPEVNRSRRGVHSLAHLKVALQCGGSDAFSGVSGNPLAALVAREVMRYGGAANLAETDELIGAEAYVLQNVRDLPTARKFLATIARFKERVAWHGHTAEGNPSGGNKFRGLYNIVLKSLGAAMKRSPDVRLDGVLEYGEPMREPGFYFMDSPGNDLESIAGQVATGCTMIFFITGNGSITNFPFVPTIKFVTTTGRFELLAQDMDVNAGAYLDGTPLPELAQQTFERTIDIASGTRSAGERAGHAQVSLWRDWPQTDGTKVQALQRRAAPDGVPLPVKTPSARLRATFRALRSTQGHTANQIGLILPTSLCSGQVARLIAARLNDRFGASGRAPLRFVALPHTEGCGASGGVSEAIFARTMLGYLTHPAVRHGLLLEHGCEKTHNDYMAHQLDELGIDRQRFGWASIQLDGGIDQVTRKVEAWFETAMAEAPEPVYDTVGLEALRLGVLAVGAVPPEVSASLARLMAAVVSAGGTVVVPETASFLQAPVMTAELLAVSTPYVTLAYGQPLPTAGFHVMETQTEHWVEILTGLGATGVDLLLAYVDGPAAQTHPLLPMLQLTSGAGVPASARHDVDLILQGDAAVWPEQLLGQILDVVEGRYIPKLFAQGNTDFQVTRGLLGISL